MKKTLAKSKHAVFLDRDGTLIKEFADRPALTPDEVEILPGVADGLDRLCSVGLVPVVVTNQGVVGSGKLDTSTLHAIHERINDLLAIKANVKIEAFYWCPHDKNGEGKTCACRKPKPGMFLEAAKDLNIDLNKSYMIGNTGQDMVAAYNAGIRRRALVTEVVVPGMEMATGVFRTFYKAAKNFSLHEAYSG